VRLYPQTLINVRLSPGQDWAASPALAASRSAVERELGAGGRVLIRASGTEPVVRVMVEAADEALARRSAEALAASLKT
jgi:phosphoglucosamine mutase